MKSIVPSLMALICLVFQLNGCGGGSGGGGGNNSSSGPVTPSVTVAPASSSISTAQSLGVTVGVSGSGGTPTGSVVLSSGSYTSSSATLSSGSATITIPAGSLATGSDTLTAKYSPDSGSSAVYNGASGTASLLVIRSTHTAPDFVPVDGVLYTASGSQRAINAALQDSDPG